MREFFTNLFRKTPSPPAEPPLQIVESIHGTYSYHLRRGDKGLSLCGKLVMPTSLPLTTWGYQSDHLNERYCNRCESLQHLK